MIAPSTPSDELATAEKIASFKAQSETANTLWTFRLTLANGHRCIITMEATFEPDRRPVYKQRYAAKLHDNYSRTSRTSHLHHGLLSPLNPVA